MSKDKVPSSQKTSKINAPKVSEYIRQTPTKNILRNQFGGTSRTAVCRLLNIPALTISTNREIASLSEQIDNGLEVDISPSHYTKANHANDHERDSYDGSMGFLTAIFETPVIGEDEDGREIRFVAEADFDACGPTHIPELDMRNIALGHAITAHKAQGSQWTQVVVTSEHVEAENNSVDNAWPYTALTCCEKRAVIVGSADSFQFHTSSAPRSFRRCVGLSLASTGLSLMAMPSG